MYHLKLLIPLFVPNTHNALPNFSCAYQRFPELRLSQQFAVSDCLASSLLDIISIGNGLSCTKLWPGSNQ